MNEIVCHPWVTHNDFPLYIDHKLSENKVQLYLQQAARTVKSTYKRMRKHSDEAPSYDSESKLMLALSEDPDNSFLVGVKITTVKELEQQGVCGLEDETREASLEWRPEKSQQFSFPLLKSIFDNPKRSEVFQRTFQEYILRNPNIYLKHPWRIGFSFSVSLRRLVRHFVQAANRLKIKVVVACAEEYLFRCVLLDSLGGPSGHTFVGQVYDFIGELVFDFKNETVPKMLFLLICQRLYDAGKKAKLYN